MMLRRGFGLFIITISSVLHSHGKEDLKKSIMDAIDLILYDDRNIRGDLTVEGKTKLYQEAEFESGTKITGDTKILGGGGLIIGEEGTPEEELTKAATISGFLIVNGFSKFNGTIEVNNATSTFNGTVDVNGGDARILDGRKLLVNDIGPTTGTAHTNFSGNVTMEKDLKVTGSIQGHFFGAVNANLPSTFSNTTNLNGTVNVNNDIFVNDSRTLLINNISPSSGLGTDTISFDGNIFTSQDLEVSGDALINGNLQVNGTLEGIEVENFTGVLDGDVSGKQATTVVDFVGGISAVNIASGVNAANAATHLNVGSEIVKRDTSGHIVVTSVTGSLVGHADSATNFTNSLNGDVSGKQATTVVDTVGGVTAANVASGANAANAATSANTASTIVKRDANGDFSAGVITLNELDLLSTNTLLINGNLAITSDGTLYVDHIAGESGSAVGDMTIIDLTVLGDFSNPSDIRLKEDITDLDIHHCLELIDQLVPHEFYYDPSVKKALGDDGHRHVGFVAQELAQIDPRFVKIAAGKQKMGNMTIEDLAFVKQELFIPLLVGALKAESAERKKLQDRIQILEQR